MIKISVVVRRLSSMLHRKDRSGIARSNTGSVITYAVLVAILEICCMMFPLILKNSGYFLR